MMICWPFRYFLGLAWKELFNCVLKTSWRPLWDQNLADQRKSSRKPKQKISAQKQHFCQYISCIRLLGESWPKRDCIFSDSLQTHWKRLEGLRCHVGRRVRTCVCFKRRHLHDDWTKPAMVQPNLEHYPRQDIFNRRYIIYMHNYFRSLIALLG